MFTISGGPSRRDFLRVGALGLGGLALPDVLRARAAGPGYARDKAVVLLWLGGGPPQHETFDPKPAAPVEIRGPLGHIPTAVPGVHFGSSLPRLAERMDRLAVVRSFASGSVSHTSVNVWAGEDNSFLVGAARPDAPTGPGMAAVYSRLRGAVHPTKGLPTCCVVQAPEIPNTLYVSRLSELLAASGNTGTLPKQYAPFNPGPEVVGRKPAAPKPGPAKPTGSHVLDDLTLRLPAGRLDDRQALLGELNRVARAADAIPDAADVHTFQRQAFDVLRRGVADAFDLSKEDPKTLARYDTGDLTCVCQTGGKTKDIKDAPTRPSLLGRQMLLARRLCEAGAGFVVVHHGDWDMHGGNGLNNIEGGMKFLGPELDRAASAFLDDVKDRGLSDDVLLVVTGEMGRTPKISKNALNGSIAGPGGRDHWPNLTPLVFAGGGLRMGQVVGRSDEHGGKPVGAAYGPSNLRATLLHYLFDVNALRVADGLPGDLVKMATDVKPVAELWS